MVWLFGLIEVNHARGNHLSAPLKLSLELKFGGTDAALAVCSRLVVSVPKLTKVRPCREQVAAIMTCLLHGPRPRALSRAKRKQLLGAQMSRAVTFPILVDDDAFSLESTRYLDDAEHMTGVFDDLNDTAEESSRRSVAANTPP